MSFLSHGKKRFIPLCLLFLFTLVADLKSQTEHISCSSEYQIVSPTTGDGSWSFVGIKPDSAEIEDVTANVTWVRGIRVNKSVTLAWKLTGDSTSHVIIVKNQGVKAALTSHTLTVCSDNAELTGIPMGVVEKIIWKPESNTVRVINENEAQTKVQNLAKGGNGIKFIVSNEFCSDTNLITVHNNSFQLDSIDDIVLCNNQFMLPRMNLQGADIKLEFLSGNGYIWSSEGGRKMVKGLDSGLNVLKWNVDYLGCADSINFNIFSNKVDAAFSWEKGLTEQSINFSLNNDYNKVSVFWDFGDGESSTWKNPRHFYSEGGRYKVSVTVINKLTNCSNTKTQYVEVGEIECIADFDVEIDDAQKSIQCLNTSKGENLNHLWLYQGGYRTSEENPQYTFQKSGRYSVKLMIANKKTFCIDEIEKSVEIGNVECNAEFITEVDSAKHSVKFVNLNSDETFQYNWLFGDGGHAEIPNPEHKYKDHGFFPVTLIIRNDDSTCFDVYKQDVLIGKRGIDVKSDFFAQVVDTAEMKVIFMNKSIGNNLKYLWSFNDSTYSSDKNPVHTYEVLKDYNVCLVVQAKNGVQDITCKNINLTGGLQADFTSLVNHEQRSVQFFDNSIGYPYSWQWDFGDGNISEKKNPVHTYSEDGYYRVILKVKDYSGKKIDRTIGAISINRDSLWITFGYELRDQLLKSGGYPADFISSSFGKPARAVWDFGDGTIDTTSLNPTHVYSKPGEYFVCVTVSDTITGQVSTECQTVVIGEGDSNVNEILQSGEVLHVFPNPLSSQSLIKYNVESLGTIELGIYSILGRQVFSYIKTEQQPGVYTVPFDASHLMDGIYLVKMDQKGKSIVKKIIIQNK